MNRFERLFCWLVVLSLLIAAPLGVQPGTAVAAPDDPTIVGGQDVPDPNPYVWQVRLEIERSDGSFLCGGSVIADRWVLTAAHCVAGNFIVFSIKAIIGERKLSDPGIEFDVITLISHRDYNQSTNKNDIALLELESAIPNANIYIVPLMTTTSEITLGGVGKNAIVTGWGRRHAIQEGQADPPDVSPDILQYLQMQIVSEEICKQNFNITNDAIRVMVCAGLGGELSTPNACQGDSGGPLVVADGHGGFIQNGIVSFGRRICDSLGLTVFTRVSSFIDDNDFNNDWIVQKTGSGADLIVEKLIVTENDVQVVIKNAGKGATPVDQGFWVDVYIDPPHQPANNETWDCHKSDKEACLKSKEGLVWGVDSPGFSFAPGQTLTLTIGGAYYWPTLSKFSGAIPADAKVWAQVDSANANSNYGGVRERHELLQADYNNVTGPAVVQASAVLAERIYLPLFAGGTAVEQGQSAASATAVLLPARAQTGKEN